MSGGPGRFRGASLGVVALVGLLVAAFALAPAFALGAAGAPATAAHVTAATPGSGLRPILPLNNSTALPSSGPGAFWLDSFIDQPLASNDSCVYEAVCENDTGQPALAINAAGTLVEADTVLTNATACAVNPGNTYSEVGVSVSTNGGSSWRTPQFFADPGCADADNYTSAMWPALTALSNDTFVLAYTQYNASSTTVCNNGEYIWWPSMAPCFLSYDRLVVSESFDNGTTWTIPTTVFAVNNSAFNQQAPIPAQPALAAFGSTVYLAWTNFTVGEFESYSYPPTPPSVGLNLNVSTDGGLTWGTGIQLPATVGNWQGYNDSVAYGPSLVVNATGALAIAYSTNFSNDYNYVCQPTGCGYLDNGPEAIASVVVATSTDEGASFNETTVATQIPIVWNGAITWYSGGPGSIVSPAPAITVNPATNEYFVAFTGGAFGTTCYSPGNCYPTGDDAFENLWVTNSSVAGGNWSAPVAIGDNVLGIFGGAQDPEFLFTPSIGVGANGTVWVNAEFENTSVCLNGNCDLWSDYAFESTDNGTTFPSSYDLGAGFEDTYYYPLWDGTDTAMVMDQGAPHIAWTWEVCPALAYCSAPDSTSWSQVVVSAPFTGAGVTVTFHETGLPSSGGNWSVDLDGNLRGGSIGTNLSVSGVPPAYNLSWSIPPIASNQYGLQYGAVSTPAPPTNFTANSVVSVDFEPFALLNVATVPPPFLGVPFTCVATFGFADDCTNQNVTPGLGPSWVPLGYSFNYGVFNITLPTYCYNCYNLSFQSWTGTGDGSWNSSSPNGSATVYGPVNETASFSLNQICSNSCFNLSYGYDFEESGLPPGTTWAVTLGNQTNTTNTTDSVVNAGPGPLPFSIWTVPYNSTWEYVGTTSTPSPVLASQGGLIQVAFHLVPISSERFAVEFGETGVPTSATGWGLELGATEYGLPLGVNATSFEFQGSQAVSLNATSVYGNTGVGAEVRSFSVQPEVIGATPFSLAPGQSLDVSGPATVQADFSPLYWLDVPTPANGTISASSQWDAAGAVVVLNATPDPGFSFVGWSGTGAGSRTSSSENISVTVNAAITEVATFAAIAPAYTVTVAASGLPSGTAFSLDLGGTTYTGTSGFTIANVAPGEYPVSAPTVVPNGTSGEQFPVTGLTSTLGLSAGVLDVSAGGTVTVDFSTQYLLTISPVVNGTVAPAPGAYWEDAGTSVALSATPATGFVLVGWTGSGSGAYSGTALTTTLVVNGPVTETATFTVYVVPPPLTYSLTLGAPTGLPSGTVWSATIGGQAEEGSGSLVFVGLNGTYSVDVATLNPSAGTEYVPSADAFEVTVTSDTQHAGPAFSTEYEVTIAGSAGGTTGATAWVPAGSTFTLSASPESGYTFVNWTGTGPGSYSGPSADGTLTVQGPVAEFAHFAPVATSNSTGSSGSSSGGSWLVPIAALVVLLVVGLIVGMVVARSGGRRRPPASSAPEAGASVGGAYGGGASAETPAPEGSTESDATGPSEGDEGGEIVYGSGGPPSA
jgi:Divergent InlB B-repeat domain